MSTQHLARYLTCLRTSMGGKFLLCCQVTLESPRSERYFSVDSMLSWLTGLSAVPSTTSRKEFLVPNVGIEKASLVKVVPVSVPVIRLPCCAWDSILHCGLWLSNVSNLLNCASRTLASAARRSERLATRWFRKSKVSKGSGCGGVSKRFTSSSKRFSNVPKRIVCVSASGIS